MTKETTTYVHHHRGVIFIAVFAVLPLALTAAFAALKYCDVVGWSWWWVSSPIWFALAGLLPIALAVKCVLTFCVKTGSKIP